MIDICLKFEKFYVIHTINNKVLLNIIFLKKDLFLYGNSDCEVKY